MATVTPIDYQQDYYQLQPSLFRESDNLHLLLQAIHDVFDLQQLDFLWLSENLLNIDVAEKSHLDFIGNLVGQSRFLTDFNTEPYFGYEGSYQSKTFGSSLDPEVGGYWNSRSYFNAATARRLSDDEYRRIIKARIISNHSNCSPNDLLEVINLITNRTDNTSQTVQHGIITVKSKDNTGILSYFVDRLYLDDNILPIAAGVRVGLEEVVRNSGEGGEDGGGDGDTPEMNFLKMRAGLVAVTPSINAGIVCKTNGGAIVAESYLSPPEFSETRWTTSGAIANAIQAHAILINYFPIVEEGGASLGGLVPPVPLDPELEYLYGANNASFSAWLASSGQPLPEGFTLDESEVVITLYPASKLPDANINQDLFDYIIDPAEYTSDDLQYFAERGVTPATKNPDGSYTLKSQLTLPMP